MFLSGLALAVWLIDRCSLVVWVGSADVLVVFTVVERESRKPIPGATVKTTVWKRGEIEQAILKTDEAGTASLTNPGVRTTGWSSLFFTDAWRCREPISGWSAEAPGYEPSKVAEDDDPLRRVSRTDPPALRVDIVLRKR
ncbi:MAG: hypothetical protein K2W96_27345 [Gemmataceae bacterium]|nr:hypothetical protein [Gemmataceae bacterium]